MDAKPYTEYLDKEMTIMGVLSAFSMATAAVILDKIAGATGGRLDRLWVGGVFHWRVALVALIAAGFFFYRQRSVLAWRYGQLALSTSRGESKDEIGRQLDAADAWDAWQFYRTAFVALTLGFVEAGLAAGKVGISGFLRWLPLGLAFLFGALQWYVYAAHPDAERPWVALLGGSTTK